METKQNKKTLSIVLKALGIIMMLGAFIALIGNDLDFWHTPELNGSGSWVYVALLTGINVWLIGIINGLDCHNEAWKKCLRAFKVLFIIALVLFAVDVYLAYPVITGNLHLTVIVYCLLGSLLGGACGLISWQAKISCNNQR